ncbi:MAG TPA: LysM peptidoglycan-binding domain-containing protein [Candidatus Krumholzibacteria bacterium]|nr:LysM peptidoglycan-binding domain-containing protein [Candidatus Krumholzibacteria bacterium]
MRSHLKVLSLLCASLLLPVFAGCGKSTGRTVNVRAGEYYTEAEVDSLSNKGKVRYCSDLEAEKTRLQAEVEANQKDIQDTRKRIEGLRGEISPTEREILRVDSEIRTLTSQINQFEALPTEYTVVPNDCLSIISNRDDIYADAYKWPRIYRANLDKIEDPVWIYPGEKLVIPRELPTEHKVLPYETLETIAGYWEVYGDPAQWTRLFEANRDKVKDPYDIPPGTIITIPR